LSLVTKLSPVRLVGLLMGVFFLSNAAGNWLAGWSARFISTVPLVTLFGSRRRSRSARASCCSCCCGRSGISWVGFARGDAMLKKLRRWCSSRDWCCTTVAV